MKRYLCLFIILLAFNSLPSFGVDPDTKASGPLDHLNEADKREINPWWRATPGVLKSLVISNPDLTAAAALEKNNQELKHRGKDGEKSDAQLVRDALRQLEVIKDPWYCHWNKHSVGRGTVKNLYHGLVAALSTAHATQKELITTSGLKTARDDYAKAEKIQNWDEKAQELDSIARRRYFTPAATQCLESLVEEAMAHGEYLAASYYFEGWKRKADLNPDRCDGISVGVSVLGAMAASAAGRSKMAEATLEWLQKCNQPADFVISDGKLFFTKPPVPASEWQKTARDLVQQIKDTDRSLDSWFPKGPTGGDDHSKKPFLEKERIRRALVFSEDPSAFPDLLEKRFPDIRKDATFCEIYQAKYFAAIWDSMAQANREEERMLRDNLDRMKLSKQALNERLANAERELAKHREQVALEPADADAPENHLTLEQLRELNKKRTKENRKDELLASAVEAALRAPAEGDLRNQLQGPIVIRAGEAPWGEINRGNPWARANPEPEAPLWNQEKELTKEQAIVLFSEKLSKELREIRKNHPDLLDRARTLAESTLAQLKHAEPNHVIHEVKKALNQPRIFTNDILNELSRRENENKRKREKVDFEKILGIELSDKEVFDLAFISDDASIPRHYIGFLEKIFKRIPQGKAFAAFDKQPLKSEMPRAHYLVSIALEAFYGKETKHELPVPGLIHELAEFEKLWKASNASGTDLANQMIARIHQDLKKNAGVDFGNAALMDALTNLDVFSEETFESNAPKVIQNRPLYNAVLPILKKVNPDRAKDLEDLVKAKADPK